MSTSRRCISSAFIALSLLFAQGASVAHALAHGMAEQQQKKQQPTQPENCVQCLSYASLGSALTSHIPTLHLLATAQGAVHTTSYAYTSLHSHPVCARGPPLIT